GIRDRNVTGVQTCALPISLQREGLLPRWLWSLLRRRQEQGPAQVLPHRFELRAQSPDAVGRHFLDLDGAIPQRFHRENRLLRLEIGRASCRERVESHGSVR